MGFDEFGGRNDDLDTAKASGIVKNNDQLSALHGINNNESHNISPGEQLLNDEGFNIISDHQNIDPKIIKNEYMNNVKKEEGNDPEYIAFKKEEDNYFKDIRGLKSW